MKTVKNPPIKKILLSGGNSSIPGLFDYFSMSMKVDTRACENVGEYFRYSKEIPSIDSKGRFYHSVTAIGLAPEILNMINLIPSEEKKRFKRFYMRVVIVSFCFRYVILLSNIMLIPAVFYASLEKTLWKIILIIIKISFL